MKASGSFPPFKFFWDNQVIQSNSAQLVLEGLAPGTYTVKVEDLKGCSVVKNITIETNPASVDLDPKDVTCFGFNNGEIITTVSNSKGELSYEWNPNPAVGGNQPHLKNLGPGTYHVTVTDVETDGTTCIYQASATIEEPTVFTLETYPLSPLCAEGANGKILLKTNGGVPNGGVPGSYEVFLDDKFKGTNLT